MRSLLPIHPPIPAAPPSRGLWCALATALALALVPAWPACAAEGLFLGWEDCRLTPGSADMNYACNNVFGVQSLFCSFTLGAPVDSVIGAEFVIDIQQSTSPLPPWWHWESGGCDAGQLDASTDFSAGVNCADAWNHQGAGLVQDIQVGQPRGGAAQERILAVAEVPSTQAVSLNVGSMYNGVRLVLTDLRLAACTGCLSPACLVLNSIRLICAPPASDVLLVTPGDANGNWATWRGGVGADCTAVPVRASTWGRVKAIYR